MSARTDEVLAWMRANRTASKPVTDGGTVVRVAPSPESDSNYVSKNRRYRRVLAVFSVRDLGVTLLQRPWWA